MLYLKAVLFYAGHNGKRMFNGNACVTGIQNQILTEGKENEQMKKTKH